MDPTKLETVTAPKSGVICSTRRIYLQTRGYSVRMAVLPIRIAGDPVLHTRALPVEDIDEGLATLIHDMEDTMSAAPGVGLAAPQVGVSLRLFVYNWRDEARHPAPGHRDQPRAIDHPGRDRAPGRGGGSGGLPVDPGRALRAARARPSALLRATDLDGELYELRADGWLARIFQHEYDHLDGILYADRLDAPHARMAAKVVRRRGWGVPGKTWLPGRDHLED